MPGSASIPLCAAPGACPTGLPVQRAAPRQEEVVQGPGQPGRQDTDYEDSQEIHDETDGYGTHPIAPCKLNAETANCGAIVSAGACFFTRDIDRGV